MKKFIVLLLILSFAAICYAQKNCIVNPKTQEIIQLFAGEITDYIGEIPKGIASKDRPYAALTIGDLAHYRTVIQDINDMIDIEQSHNEVSKESIRILKHHIQFQISSIEETIKRIEKFKPSHGFSKHINKTIDFLNHTKDLLIKLNSELPATSSAN